MVIIARSAAVQNAARFVGHAPASAGPTGAARAPYRLHREERFDAQLLQRNVLRRAKRCDRGEELKGYRAFAEAHRQRRSRRRGGEIGRARPQDRAHALVANEASRLQALPPSIDGSNDSLQG